MAKTKSMTRNQDYDDDATSRNRFKTCENGGVVLWSQLNHDVLFIILTKLGIIDFFTFSEVCKSWRSFALCNKKRFMVSKPPMYIGYSIGSNEKEYCLVDVEGRKFKTTIPYSADWTCVGLTCGYLVLYGKWTSAFWLVKPITRHELHFPRFLYYVDDDKVKTILVSSPSIPDLLLVVINRSDKRICFSTAGTGVWKSVIFAYPVVDVHAFKGKIYTIDTMYRVNEIGLGSEAELTLLYIKSCPKRYLLIPVFVSLGERLYVVDRSQKGIFVICELDFVEMKWVIPKETVIQKYFYFILRRKYEMGVPDRFLNVDLINE